MSSEYEVWVYDFKVWNKLNIECGPISQVKVFCFEEKFCINNALPEVSGSLLLFRKGKVREVKGDFVST